MEPFFSLVKDRANGDLWASATGTALGGSFRRFRYRWDGATWARVGDEPATWDSGAISVAGGVVWSSGESLVRSEGGRAVRIECPASSQGYFSSVYAAADRDVGCPQRARRAPLASNLGHHLHGRDPPLGIRGRGPEHRWRS